MVEGWLAGLEAFPDTEHLAGEKGNPLPCQTTGMKQNCSIYHFVYSGTSDNELPQQ